MPSTGDFTAAADPALEILDQQLLPVPLQASRLQLELETFLLQARGFHCVVMRQLCLVEFVLGPLEIALADDALVPRSLRPGKFPLGSTDRHACHVRVLLALQDLAANVDLLAAQVDDEASCVARSRSNSFLSRDSRRSSRSPFLTASPAFRLRVTVPAAGAYIVGLTAATTVACAATSLRNSPRVTVAMRTRSSATVASVDAQPCRNHARTAAPSTSSATAAVMRTRRSCCHPVACSTTRS
jgi:hypothetical protein